MKRILFIISFLMSVAAWSDDGKMAYQDFCRYIGNVSNEFGNLNEQSVINAGIICMQITGRDTGFSMEEGASFKFLKPEDDLKKALAVSLLRAIPINWKALDRQLEDVKGFGSCVKIESKSSQWEFDIAWRDSIVSLSENTLLDRILEDYGVPFVSLPDFSSMLYSRELINVFGEITAQKMADNGIEKNHSSFEFLARNIKSSSIEGLVRKYEFYENFKNSTVEFSLSDGSPADSEKSIKSVALSGDRLKAFLLMLMRLQLSADNMGISHRYIGKGDLSLDGETYSVKMSLPNGDSSLIYVKNGFQNIVGIKTINDNMKAMPGDGIYYSPEFYRMTIGIFAEIARKNFLE